MITLEASTSDRYFELITRYLIGHISNVGKSNHCAGHGKAQLVVCSCGESRTSESLRDRQNRNHIHHLVRPSYRVPAIIARVSKACLMDLHRCERQIDMKNARIILLTTTRLHLRWIRDAQNDCSLNVPSIEEIT